ncbi:PQQ-dependent sugar dehydrogenase [Halobacillus salinus]|uniref:PQQ-dependent sugar dehydrogenase n=1 Tax=Halobacillus salinus TaxID=192814 RepID=UPI0009A8C83E|nr:PQQ-dependent sugar dehydrogenase [Halobacillus salinus]
MKSIAWLFLVVFLVSCQPPVEEKQTGGSVVVDQLQSPWDIEHHDGQFMISERDGTIVTWSEGTQLQRDEVLTNEEISQIGEGGLLGFRLHPQFVTNQLAFAYHSYMKNDEVKNRLIVLKKETEAWREVEVLLDDIPGARFHNGGRVEIGPDEKLYVTTGDSLVEQLAQQKDSLAGKILRMNLDGTIPEDNPFDDSYVFSFGHRNPQGLAWSDSGELFASEHGPDAHDEINLIESGQNYGWPLFVGEEHDESVTAPIFQTGDKTWAPSGLAVYKDKLWVATLRGTAVRTLSFSGEDPTVVSDDNGRVRDVEHIDGKLFFITNNTDGRGNPVDGDDRLIRLSK